MSTPEKPAVSARGRRPLLTPVSELLGTDLRPPREDNPDRSRSPHDLGTAAGAAGAASQVSKELHSKLQSFAEKELGKSLYADHKKTIEKHVLKLAGYIESVQKFRSRIVKTTATRDVYKSGKDPVGRKPFAVCFECTFLDSVLSTEDCTLSLLVPTGTSLRHTMKAIHYQSQAWQLDLELKVLIAQFEHYRNLGKFTTFAERVRCDVEHPADRYSDLGLDLSDITLPSTVVKEQLEAKMKVVFLRTVEAAANSKKLKAEADKKKALAKSKVIEKMVASTPKDLFNAAVDQRVKTILGTPSAAPPGLEVDAPAAFLKAARTMNPLTDDEANAVVSESAPKNGMSPAAGGGTIPKGSGKAKKKGTGGNKGSPQQKGAGKGKGKSQHGKGQDTNKGKGKGRGKGKGKEKENSKTKEPKGTGSKGAGPPRSGKGRGSGGGNDKKTYGKGQ